MNTFWRVTVNTQQGRRTYWARDLRKDGERFSFRVVTHEGSRKDVEHIVIGLGADMVSARPARLNLTYGTLELIEGTEQ